MSIENNLKPIAERLATDDTSLILEPIHQNVLSQWIGGLMIRSSTSSYKFIGTERLLRRCGLGFPIHSVNDKIDERIYNKWTTEPGLTAAMKSLQISRDSNAMVSGVFGQEIGDKLILSVANDVMQLTVCNQGDLAHRKLPTEMNVEDEGLKRLSKEDVFEFLRHRLVPHSSSFQINYNGDLQHKIFVGEAAFSLNHKRGVAGHTQTYFTSVPFTESSLALYVFGLNGAKEKGFNSFDQLLDIIGRDNRINDEDVSDLDNGVDLNLLLRVNGGLAWENVVLRNMITSVGGESVNSPYFQGKYEQLMRRILGMGSDKLNLLLQAVFFNLKNRHGKIILTEGKPRKNNSKGRLIDSMSVLVRTAGWEGDVGSWDKWPKSVDYNIFGDEE